MDEVPLGREQSTNLQLEVNVARVFPLLSLQQYEAAAATIRESKDLLKQEHSLCLETELHYNEAAFYFMLQDDAEATNAANRALSASDDFFSSYEHPIQSASNLKHNRAKALQLLALIHSRKQQYHEQARLNRLAIMELRQSATPDEYLSAILKMNLSFYVRDLDSSRDAELLDCGNWPSNLSWKAAEISRSLSLLSAAQGRFDDFAKMSAAASELSSSDSFKQLLVAEKSYIHRMAFDIVDASSLLTSFSVMMSQTTTPDDDDYRDALLYLAQEISIIDPAKSQLILERWHSSNNSTTALRLHDTREAAESAFANAIILKNCGKDSINTFFQAFETWNNVGYRKFAAAAAVELAELTRNPTFAAYARREAELRPGSWLDLRVRRMNV